MLSSLIPNSISKKSRKEEGEASGDGIYYEQLIPPLVKQMHKALRSGQLGILHPGNHLLARYEDRTVWIQMAEKGNGYVYYLAKGLELQETSCHSLEVTRIDDIFQETFERNSALNYFAFHTLTPLLSLPVSMYSSSKNILTGIIESPDTLVLISKVFSKTLIWYYVKTILDKFDHREEKQSAVIKDENEIGGGEKDNEEHIQVIPPRSSSIGKKEKP